VKRRVEDWYTICMNEIKQYFSLTPPHDRIGRKKFAVVTISALAIIFVTWALFLINILDGAMGMGPSKADIGDYVNLIITFSIIILSIVAQVYATIRRFKDVGMSGWWAVVMFVLPACFSASFLALVGLLAGWLILFLYIPLYFVFALYLMFKKGQYAGQGYISEANKDEDASGT